MHKCSRIGDPSKVYAIKSIDKIKIKRSRRSIQAVLNEIDIMREMDHPNIIKLHEVYESPKYIYMLLDYIDGGELFKAIQNTQNFSEKKAVAIMKKLLGALAYLHKQRVVHRDLKPENLLLH